MYALVTCEDGQAAVKAFDRYVRPSEREPVYPRSLQRTPCSSLPIPHLFRHPWTAFLAALKGASALDLTRLGPALKRALNALHLQRLAAGTDAWGLGYQPAGLEPTALLLLTDATELTSLEGVAEARSSPRQELCPTLERCCL